MASQRRDDLVGDSSHIEGFGQCGHKKTLSEVMEGASNGFAFKFKTRNFMKPLWPATLSIIAGFGLGIFAGRPLAQTAPPAYVITLFDSGLRSATDTDYPSLNPATFQPYGGHYIIHFGKTVSFD